MEKLHELKEILMDSLNELDTLKGHKLKMGELEAIKAISSSMDHLCNVAQDMEAEGYSEDGYGRGSSYANRGQHYVRGHYSRDDGMRDGVYSSRRDSRGRYSRGDSTDQMMEHVRMAVETAPVEYKEAAWRFMRELENG